jgi:hypothetical protein
MVLLNFRLFPLGAQPTFLLLKDSCQRVQDVWRRLTRRPTDFDPRSGYFDADGVAAQLMAVFGESPGEVAHRVCDSISKTSQTVDPNRGRFARPFCSPPDILLLCVSPAPRPAANIYFFVTAVAAS